MRNTRVEETQAGIKIARRNINNLRYAEDGTIMAESEEELKRLLMKVKEESVKVFLNLSWAKRDNTDTKFIKERKLEQIKKGKETEVNI